MSLAHFFTTCCLIAATLVAVNLWFVYQVLHPLRRLSLQTEKLAGGDLSALDEPCGGIKEIDRLRCSMASMAAHVLRAQEQNRAYTDMLINGQESERARIARELHDETIQSLIAISQNIEIAKTNLTANTEKAKEFLQSARRQAVETVSELRNLIGDLRPPALEELGLVTALKMRQSKLSDMRLKIEVEGNERRLKESHELALFRCAQEAIMNARRHAETGHIHISLIYAPDEVRMVISDHGKGFSPPSKITDLANNCHYGLAGIQERIQHLRGKVEILSSPGEGTILKISIPQTPDAQPHSTVHDPVCSAIIHPHQAYGNTIYRDNRYYFCCPVCQGAFQQNPELYLTPTT